jgi:PBSX family phage terminase large subunit
MTFTMADNLSMTDEQIRAAIKSVPKGTAFYIRDVLGQRRQAEGLVYSKFNYDLHTVPVENRSYSRYIVSIDWGMRNPFAAILWGFHDKVWYAVREFGYVGKTAGGAENYKEVSEYIADIDQLVNGLKIERVICDPSATPFINSLRKKYTIQKGDNAVMAGIQDVVSAFHHGLIKINRCCKQLIQEIETYSFDEKKDGEDAVVKENDHFCDSKRYFVRTMRLADEHRARTRGGDKRRGKQKHT